MLEYSSTALLHANDCILIFFEYKKNLIHNAIRATQDEI